MVALIVVLITPIIGGIVYCTKKKQKRRSVRQEFEIPQYAEVHSDSKAMNAPETSHYYEVIRESTKYESTSQIPPPIKMKKNMTYGVGNARTHGVEGGQCYVIQAQAPSGTHTESAAPHMMTMNAAYEVTGQMM